MLALGRRALNTIEDRAKFRLNVFKSCIKVATNTFNLNYIYIYIYIYMKVKVVCRKFECC